METTETSTQNGEQAGSLDEPERKGSNLKIETNVAEEFRQMARSSGTNQTRFLARLIEVYKQEAPAIVRDEDGSLLVTYRAIAHVPVQFDGTVRRVSPPAEAGPADEHPTNEDG